MSNRTVRERYEELRERHAEAQAALARWGIFASKTGLTAADAEQVIELRRRLAECEIQLDRVRGLLSIPTTT